MSVPSREQLLRSKPGAKCLSCLSKDRTRIEPKWVARLGRQNVCNQGEPQLWDTEEEAASAAIRFRAALEVKP